MYIQAAGVTTALLAGVGVSLVAILRAAERSVGLAPPTAAMLAAEVHSNLRASATSRTSRTSWRGASSATFRRRCTAPRSETAACNSR